MKTELQRIAIARVRGWLINGDKPYGTPPSAKDQPWAYIELLPDYLNDLNAMHEAEKVLTAHDKPCSSRTDDYATVRYCSELRKIVGAELREVTLAGNPALNTFVDSSPFEEWKLIQATAAQKAEAFLRALGLWKS